METGEVINLQADVLVRIEKAGIDNPRLRNIIRVLGELSKILLHNEDTATEYDDEDVERNLYILTRDMTDFLNDIRRNSLGKRMVEGRINPKFHPFYAILIRDGVQLVETMHAGIDFVREGTADGRFKAAHAFEAALVHLRGASREA